MVIKKENLKETEIVLEFNPKTIDIDIKKILNDIEEIKKKPFQDIFLFLPKEFANQYLFKLIKNLKYKDFVEQKKQLIIKI